jgi:hypothetical protein
LIERGRFRVSGAGPFLSRRACGVQAWFTPMPPEIVVRSIFLVPVERDC